MRTVNPQRHAERRAHILEAAAALFAERGFDRTTTAAICKEARIGSGTLFHYFPDKGAIFHALFADDLERTRANVTTLDESDPLAALVSLIEHRIAEAGNPLVPGLLIAAIIRATQDEQFATLIDDDETYLRETIARLLRAAATTGYVDTALDPELTARWLCGLIDALYFQAANADFDPPSDSAMFRLIVHRLIQPQQPCETTGSHSCEQQ
jgi:AcrR family transcriptional regulator